MIQNPSLYQSPAARFRERRWPPSFILKSRETFCFRVPYSKHARWLDPLPRPSLLSLSHEGRGSARAGPSWLGDAVASNAGSVWGVCLQRRKSGVRAGEGGGGGRAGGPLRGWGRRTAETWRGNSPCPPVARRDASADTVPRGRSWRAAPLRDESLLTTSTRRSLGGPATHASRVRAKQCSHAPFSHSFSAWWPRRSSGLRAGEREDPRLFPRPRSGKHRRKKVIEDLKGREGFKQERVSGFRPFGRCYWSYWVRDALHYFRYWFRALKLSQNPFHTLSIPSSAPKITSFSFVARTTATLETY